ncbi:hypothetical protein AtubIFM55763_008273 [Aspergillus tubingensis]|uniref:Uncharacterized protein n=1 Tax=Aspergillus tubingensis TaxID=5068 RepID=A0A8H3SRG5_ASPTU|nr:uncharacterized protein AtWU_04337 [Aspergillus tubingensis]GFN14537.1 reticulocyte-binding protein 2 homolog a [Aspergillus tubingensis]GLA57348.1 hypothetical protein AtubIFM54640_003480 [Aspergillus tubingensis]GLA69092.1 hypothetical protein AtubIFM55763_008273 [Aspergillus tubingensis]GLA87892.1 hypothetical protein AtubIFM56815_002325 [Aspergillus tubingensis]GLA97658.1 hypothetical protein AtubIFM57143_005586 [Aspergillus tubingensis]
MPATPERRSDRGALARRNREYPQDQQLSPFGRARHTRLTDNFDASFVPNTYQDYNSRQHRRNFSQTGSIRAAFNYTSRLHNMSDHEAAAYTHGTPNRNRRQSFNFTSPESNPPNELAEAYRQIDDAGSLADLDPDDEDFNISLRDSRSRRSSSASRLRGDDLFAAADADFLNEISDDGLRRKLVNHVEDEKRLRRATSSRSPVLSNAGTPNPLTSENLQRREEEEEQQYLEEEENDGLRPSLNLPSNWGSRAAHRRDWLRKMTRRTELPENPAVRAKETSPPRLKFDRDSHLNHTEPTHVESTTPAGRPSNRYNRIPLSDAQNKLSEQKADKLTDGDPIPNTPIVVYKNSTFTKRSPTKRDSQDLLRKLSRTESPGQRNELKTPEAQKYPERRIYDKTPVVTGAWIDTPVTERVERVNELPEHLSRDIAPSPPRNERFESSLVPSHTRQASQSHEFEERRLREEREREEQEEKKRMEQQDREQRLKEERQKEEQQREEKERLEREREKEKERENVEKPAQEKPEKKAEHDQSGKSSGKAKSKDRAPLIKPDLPKSALETVLKDYKDHKESLDVGDDTIESLQDIIDGQPGALKTEDEDDAAYEKEILKKLELASSGDKETVDLDRLNEKLKSLADNIQKVKTGLDGLEVQVSRDADTLAAIPSPPKGKRSKNHICENCNGESDSRVYALVTLPRLWRRSPVSGRIHLTRLGWCSLILLLWFYSESTMCDFYCHPSISETCQGNCLLPDAPRFPYVIPTMLWRWLHLSSIFTPLWTLAIALSRLIAQMLGFWDGYVEEEPIPVNLTGEIRIHGRTINIPTAEATSRGFFSPQKLWPGKGQPIVPQPVPELKVEVEDMSGRASSWDDDGSMDDDEYI